MSNSPTQRFNICAARKYTTRDGQEKTQWVRLGEATDWSDGSRSARQDVVPVGNWFDGKLYLFPADDEQRGNGGGRAQGNRNPNAGSSRSPMAQAAIPAQAADDFDDPSIPF